MALLIVDLDRYIGNAQSWRDTFAAQMPGLEIRFWPEAGGLADIDYLAFMRPDFDALPDFPKLKAMFSRAAGVETFVDHPRLPPVPLGKIEPPGGDPMMTEYVVMHVLRRSAGAPMGGPRVRIGRRLLDLERRVLVDPEGGVEERLAASEFNLLKIFAENPNRPLMRDWLLEVTAHREAEVFDRAIDLRITRLRRKVEADPAHPDAIRTVRGVGYMFVPPKD